MAADPAAGAANTYYVPFPILGLASNGGDIFLTAGGGGSLSVKEVPNVVHAHRYSEASGKLSTIAALNTGTNLVVNLTYSPITKLWLASSRKGCKILSLNVEDNTLTEISEWSTESEGKEPEQNFAIYSGDASFIVTGGTDGCVKLWKSGEPGKEPTFHRDLGSKTKEILDAAFSPDDKHVAACDGTGNCRLWEVAKEGPDDGKLFEYKSDQIGGKGLIKLVRFVASADGSTNVLLAANGNQRKMNWGVVGLFSLDGAQLKSVVVDKGPLKSMALSVDNQRLVVGLMTGKKVVLNMPTLKSIQKTKELHSLPSQCVAFTGECTAISVSGDRDIHLLKVSAAGFDFGFLVQIMLMLIVVTYLMFRIGLVGAAVGQGRTDL